MVVCACANPASDTRVSTPSTEPAAERVATQSPSSIPSGFYETNFGGEGLASIEEDRISLEPGVPLAGVTWAGEAALPVAPYWIEVDFTKRFGSDFACALTFPAAGSHLSLVLGGWGGTVCGLSSLDGEDASRNPTRFLHAFPPGVRAALRVEVRDTLVRAWLDRQLVVDADLTGHEVNVRAELLPSCPLGLAAFATAVDFHRIQWGELPR